MRRAKWFPGRDVGKLEVIKYKISEIKYILRVISLPVVERLSAVFSVVSECDHSRTPKRPLFLVSLLSGLVTKTGLEKRLRRSNESIGPISNNQ